MKHSPNLRSGFTIVELLIVIVVIAILAAITIVSYNGILNRSKEALLKSDLQSGAKQISFIKTTSGSYPADTSGLKKSDSTTFSYTASVSNYCLGVTSSGLANKSYYITEGAAIQEGICPPVEIQTVTAANCPTNRTLTKDVRDNHTYWVQRLADGRCWMLTNLGYAGGGTNTYGDTKTLINGTGGSATYTVASYYIVPSTTNYTTEPATPSTATNGTGQLGYLYNWCGAMGGQATAACANATTPTPNTSVSVCPAGWRLPTGNGGEFGALNTAINGGSTSTDAGLRTVWLAQLGGYWDEGIGFQDQGNNGGYWSASVLLAPFAYRLSFDSSGVYLTDSMNKYYGAAVRCVAT